MSQLPMFGQPDEATEAPEDVTEMLPVFDYGYFDALVAVGFAALADAYFDTEGSPLIERDPTGFSVSYTQEPRENLDLGWLRYSLAADWKEKDWFENGWTLVKDADAITEKREGVRQSHEALIHAEGALIDTSDDSTVDIKVGGETYGIAEPRRKLVPPSINSLTRPGSISAFTSVVIKVAHYSGMNSKRAKLLSIVLCSRRHPKVPILPIAIALAIRVCPKQFPETSVGLPVWP
jgi:hypothetical protein